MASIIISVSFQLSKELNISFRKSIDLLIWSEKIVKGKSKWKIISIHTVLAIIWKCGSFGEVITTMLFWLFILRNFKIVDISLVSCICLTWNEVYKWIYIGIYQKAHLCIESEHVEYDVNRSWFLVVFEVTGYFICNGHIFHQEGAFDFRLKYQRKFNVFKFPTCHEFGSYVHNWPPSYLIRRNLKGPKWFPQFWLRNQNGRSEVHALPNRFLIHWWKAIRRQKN